MQETIFRLFDTATRQVQHLTTNELGHLRVFSLGAELVEEERLGHFRSHLTADLVARTARAIGWKVTWVSGILDIAGSTELGAFHNAWEQADHWVAIFKENWNFLNLSEPQVRPRSSQHVRDQILAAQRLVANGQAYVKASGVYFGVSELPEYGDLSGVSRSTILNMGNPHEIELDKRDLTDFRVWKTDGSAHSMRWHSPFGWGYPNRALGASTMSRAYLGPTLDLYVGDETDLFPHHEAEVAQSQALTGRPYSTRWTHTGKLSGDRFGSLHDLLCRGTSPLTLRWVLLAGHYSKSLSLSEQSLHDAERNRQRVLSSEALAKAAISSKRPGPDALSPHLHVLYEEALEAMASNLNSCVALAKLIEVARSVSRQGQALSASSATTALEVFDKFNLLLGVVRSQYAHPQNPCEKSVDAQTLQELLLERTLAKSSKDYARADQIRSQISSMGLELRDSPDGEQKIARRSKKYPQASIFS